MKLSSRHPFITGTIILTLTGLVSRFIGFFYRIYLSRLFGEEGMGLYQLIGPVLSISLSLCAAGYQTAISKLVAEKTATEKNPSLKPMWAGFLLAMPLSFLCNYIVYVFAEPIADNFLKEPRTASLLRILSFSIPLSTVHSCVNGYFYGQKKALVPAVSQIMEQLSRVSCVFLLSANYLKAGTLPPVSVAIWGLAIGEFVSMLFSWIAVFCCIPTARSGNERSFLSATGPLFRDILAMALPLTANRIVLNMLQSIESVSIPTKLRIYGFDSKTALSIYGVLTGMAMPFLFFPNALTSSVAILLLPTISENYALKNMETVKSATRKTFQYCGVMGLICMAGFVLLGNQIGTLVFKSPLAGYFITTLGFICPFLYLDTTLSAILQGLGKVGQIFVMNVISILIRLIFILNLIPIFGMKAYFWGLLMSQLIQCFLYVLCLRRILK